MLYALQLPDGKLVEWSVSDDRDEIISHAYHHAESHILGWGSRYWKQWEAGWRAAQRRGYRCVQVRLVRVPGKKRGRK